MTLLHTLYTPSWERYKTWQGALRVEDSGSTPTARPAVWNVREINPITEDMGMEQDTVTQILESA